MQCRSLNQITKNHFWENNHNYNFIFSDLPHHLPHWRHETCLEISLENHPSTDSFILVMQPILNHKHMSARISTVTCAQLLYWKPVTKHCAEEVFSPLNHCVNKASDVVTAFQQGASYFSYTSRTWWLAERMQVRSRTKVIPRSLCVVCYSAEDKRCDFEIKAKKKNVFLSYCVIS